MATTIRRIVQKRADSNEWEIVAPHASRASAVMPTQRAAEARAKEIVANLGGGEVTVKDRHGRVRDSDTVRPGNDLCPPRDKKH